MANIKDVANLANVSITTVSMVLNNTDNKISEKTRQNVIDAAKKLNYSPNRIARSLVTKKSNAVMLVIPDISNPFFGIMAKELSVLFEKDGYLLYIYNSNVSTFDEKIFLDLVEKNFIGLSLIVDRRVENFSLDTKKKHKIIFLDEMSNSNDDMTVTCDNEMGGYIAANYIIDSGYKNTGVITGNMNSLNSIKRFKGFKKAFEKRNIRFDNKNIVYGDYTFESGYKNAENLIKNNIDSVFCFNDMMAFGFISYCKNIDKNIPDDIAVMGFDDTFMCDIVSPRLTSISQNISQIAKNAYELSKKILNGENIDKKKIFVEPVLIKRQSVKEVK